MFRAHRARRHHGTAVACRCCIRSQAIQLSDPRRKARSCCVPEAGTYFI
ncbi:hypothetical protein [Burkholderia thailandensis]|nr:hypothetical protein [Burkholderia thailandensis]AVR11783.1 chemotaxis protein [Burkholderia thailandensis]AVR26879.1 chemotaxis protein [Burkholderia thailandensis]AWY60216.1 chemotaxis protein [Burkholderia thailandensis]AWY69554.1 chemotaxis protein [Burkholderia thailandensis]MBS2129174.1 chemotaxis protein [Burkholderia thailandensis]